MSLHANEASYESQLIGMPEDKSWSPASGAGSRTKRSHASRTVVAPFARGLAILAAFSPHDPWLGNQKLMLETSIPASTVSRLVRSLVVLGYLHYSPARRKYRLAAPVLSLGYAAITHSGVQQFAYLEMQAFANANDVWVVLCARDRLAMIVLEARSGQSAEIDVTLCTGTRLHIASSPMG